MINDNELAVRRYRQSEDIVAREIAGEMLLVPIRNNLGDLESIYTLNETGAFIWSQMDGTHTLAEVCAAMQAEFEVSQDEAWADLLEFVSGLETIPALVEVQ